MIQRNNDGIIMQHNRAYPDYSDGGDSCARCGLMAMAGSKLDQDLLFKFLDPWGHLVRHPTGEGSPRNPTHALPEFTSRDNLIQWAAGIQPGDAICQHAADKYAGQWFINKDILMFDTKLFLKKKSSIAPPLWLVVLGTANMFLTLLWACFVTPDEEQNKTIAMCIAFGPPWIRMLLRWHPDLRKNLETYWGGSEWRNQIEISDAIWACVRREALT